MVYFELIDKKKNQNKFWEIKNIKSVNPPKVVVKYGRIGTNGIIKEFVYHNKTWGEDYMAKQIEHKIKKGYIKKTKK